MKMNPNRRTRKHSAPQGAPEKTRHHGSRRLLWMGILVVVLAAGGAGLYLQLNRPAQAGASSVPPNVLLISIDMLRPDHLGCYGYSRPTSPHIDRLAEEGVLFENHISSSSWTLPAHAALFTSLYDSVHGCTDTDKKLADNVVTLAEKFAQAGYQTAGFFSGPYLHPAFGLGRGFEHYEDCTSYAAVLDDTAVDQWAMDPDVMRASHRDITSPRVYAAFKKWFDEHRGSKFFLFVHLWDPHFDFIPPPPYDTLFDPNYAGTVTGTDFFFDPNINADMPARDLEHLIALYDGEIAWTDSYVGKILDDFQQAGLLDHTVVALTSDHGTEFFEHGDKAHRKTLFDEVIRIPLLLRYPAQLGAGIHIHSQTRSIDVGPTLLELAGVSSAVPVMGRSLVPLALDPARPFNELAVSELFSVGHRIRSLRSLHWKFFDNQAGDQRFFVDLGADPGEHHLYGNLTKGAGRELNKRYEAMVRVLDAWQARICPTTTPTNVPENVRRQLESLGYLSRPDTQPAQEPN
jgi:arylsulfatase A-like enzyme